MLNCFNSQYKSFLNSTPEILDSEKMWNVLILYRVYFFKDNNLIQ